MPKPSERPEAPFPSGLEGPPPSLPPRPPGCLATFALLPFVPSLWVRSASLPLWRTLAPLYALICVASALIAYAFGQDLVEQMIQIGDLYEEREWSTVVISSDGVCRVDGDAPPRFEAQGRLYAVDLTEELAEVKKRYDDYFILGEEAFEKKQHGRVRVTPLKEIGFLVPEGGLRIDGPEIKAMVRRYDTMARAFTVIVMGAILTVIKWLTALIYATLAGSMAMSIAGRSRGLQMHECFKIALAVVAAKTMIEALTALTGSAVLLNAGLTMLYLVMVTFLTVMAVLRVEPIEEI